MSEQPLAHLVRLRPRTDALYTSQSRTCLATQLDGFVNDGPQHGLFVYQTRLLSRYRYRINGRLPEPVALANVEQHNWLGYYIVPPPQESGGAIGGKLLHAMKKLIPGGKSEEQGAGGDPAQQTIELRLSRFVGDGLHEDVELTNFTQRSMTFALQLDVDADFADQKETASGKRQQKGERKIHWQEAGGDAWQLNFDYLIENRFDHQGETGTAHLHRGVIIRIEKPSSPPSYDGGTLSFPVELPPHGRWRTCVNIIPLIDGQKLQPLYGCRSFNAFGRTRFDERRQKFLDEATAVESPGSGTLSSVVVEAAEQAKRDLAALRLYDLDHGEHAWIAAAGLPIYIGLFGRDTLFSAWQAGMLSTDQLKGTLPELARQQGQRNNDWRDERPGRMLHQVDTGPLAVLNIDPLGHYYGGLTTSSFFPVSLSELWHWTGDKELIRPLIEPALRAMRSLDEFNDRDGDGFHEYQKYSEKGIKNQGWKDSDDAIVYEDGSIVPDPIALCEVQGYGYMAKVRMAQLLWWFDRKDEAKEIHRQADELKKRFNDKFWMEEEGFFALGLDKDKRQIRSIASNPGHCIGSGIVEDSLIRRTADRLLEDELFSGWGVRTLSDKHPAYDPYSYHRGTVWPFEQGIFVLGFYRHGLHEQVERLSRAQFEAAALFDFYRLPEVFSGHPRDDEHPFPALYPKANSPQAWSASSIFCHLQSLLGLYPFAPLDLLLVDPHLPEWLPAITLRHLRVGASVVSIHFERRTDGSSDYEVVEKEGSLHVVHQPSPWSLTAGFGERLRDALMSFV